LVCNTLNSLKGEFTQAQEETRPSKKHSAVIIFLSLRACDVIGNFLNAYLGTTSTLVCYTLYILKGGLNEAQELTRSSKKHAIIFLALHSCYVISNSLCAYFGTTSTLVCNTLNSLKG
jgi:hypothetical protein